MSGKNNTRNEILDVADHLLMQRGYSSFSYKHIAIALGMRNAAVHYHFAAKSDLGVALVQRHRQRFSAWCASVDNRTASATDKLMEFIEIRASGQTSEHCVIAPEVVVSADYGVLPEEMQQEARALLQDMVNWLSEVLTAGLHQGDFNFPSAPEDMALTLVATLHGAPQMAKANAGYRVTQMAKNLLALISVNVVELAEVRSGGAAA